MSTRPHAGPVSLNSLADRKPAPRPLQLAMPSGRTTHYYPTGQPGQYVKVDHDFLGRLVAQLVVGLDEAHPLWKHLTPASLDAETAVRHLLAVAAELAAVESMVPSSASYDDAGLP